jgi:hypothetical protein
MLGQYAKDKDKVKQLIEGCESLLREGVSNPSILENNMDFIRECLEEIYATKSSN